MKERLVKEFEKIFGDSEGVRVFFAPGRVNLIGEHTDYNGGHVFPCALTIGTYAAVRKRDDRELHFYSMNFESVGVVNTSLDDMNPKKDDNWTAYPKGVIWAFGEKGYTVPCGFDMVLYGNIPNGSGLSSSASLEVLTGTILRALFDIDIDNTNIALIGQYSENNYNGMNCGIMDQFASAMGKKDNAIFLDTATLKYEYAPVVLENASIVVTNSKVKHSLVNSEYNLRRSECEKALADLKTVTEISTLGDLSEEDFEKYKSAIKDEICVKRAKHAVYENQRTIKAIKALNDGEIDEFGKLMIASHVSLRDDYSVSCEEIDILVEEALKIPGVIGSRITGGGFGGCTVSIVKNDSIDDFKENVGREYTKKTGIEAEFYIVSVGDGPVEL
ncbi:MAG: galactokinase [Lachnospiraceae bacterium]|nr:galactokinase [Candidatus Colinaster scatohippi]